MRDPRAPENVLYLLGAGFSAPLGVPVMSNFLSMAKDQFADNPKEFEHFAPIFDKIKRLGDLKNVFRADLSNIEEILSILEVPTFLEQNGDAGSFATFLADVVSYYTPTPKLELPRPSGRACHTFGVDGLVNGYAHFVAALFNLRIPVLENVQDQPTILRDSRAPLRYSVITTNYDRVLELYADFISTNWGIQCTFMSIADAAKTGFNGEAPALAKLHGGVGDVTIVPPTWSKGSHPKIVPHWQASATLISQAHHIRIIGYSLAPADAYIRFLLKHAVLDASNLKTVDVICLDDAKGTVERNYRTFFSRDFKGYRFRSQKIEDLFVPFINQWQTDSGSQSDALERAHQVCFAKPLVNETRHSLDGAFQL